MAAHLLAITYREPDIEFCRQVCSTYGFELHVASNVSEVRRILTDYTQIVVFWDVDHPKADRPSDPASALAIGQTLAQFVPPERVVAVSAKPLKDTPYLFHVPVFGHYVFRRHDAASLEIYARIGMACMRPDPFGLEHYLPEGAAIKKITLQRASHRAAAVEAVQKVFLAANGHSRLASMLARTCDELLMNAIFSAPVDADGKPYRAQLERSSDFELGAREQVTLELASTEQYFAVLVADQFGSLKKERILPFIQKDYEHVSYRPDSSASAGLGLYATLQSGQSLLFVSKPKHRTEVAVFFPMVRSPREFKETFRFFSFILR